MSKSHHCIGCDKSFASAQSLWNHKQRCFRPKKEDSTVQSKDKIIGDILNNVDQRVKDSSSVKKPELKMDDVVPIQIEPKSDLSFEEKKNSDPESDFESSSEKSEESDYEILDYREKLKENFRNLYMIKIIGILWILIFIRVWYRNKSLNFSNWLNFHSKSERSNKG